MANALAVHMKPNKYEPMLALMLISATLPITLRKMTNITVAMTDAAVTKSALRKVRMAIGSVHHREKTLMGMRNIRTKERQAEVRKRPNITFDAILIRSRISLIFAGRLMVAPASSSFLSICTGLNQYRVFGGEQNVTPSVT